MGTWWKSTLAFGIASPEFRRENLSRKLALLATLALPFQQALTIDVGFPIKISEVLMAAAVVIAAVSGIARKDVRNIRIARWTIDRVLVAIIAITVVASTLIVVIGSHLTDQIPGVERSSIVDLALYTCYGLFVVFAWWIVRGASARLIGEVLIQSSWLCGIAVLAQVISRFIPDARYALAAVGFSIDRWGAEIAGVTFMRNGPFLEGQHLGFYAGAMFVLALYKKRFVSASIALGCAFISISTTAFVAIAISLVVTTILRPSKVTLIASTVTAAVMSAAIAVVPTLRSLFLFQLGKLNLFGLGDGAKTVSLDVRSAKTDIGWRMMWDHPFGVGSGRFGVYFHDYVGEYDSFSDYITSGQGRAIAENVYLQIGAELGVVAACAFVALLVAIGIAAWRRSRAGLAVVIFVAVGSLTQSSWTFLPIWMLLAFAAAYVVKPLAMSGIASKQHSERRAYRAELGPDAV